MLHFYNTFLNLFNISCLFSGGIPISSTGCFSILLSFDLVTVPVVLFRKNSRALWTTFLEAVFTACNSANDKNPYLLAYFLLLCSIEYRPFLFINKQCQMNFIFYL